MDKIERRFLYCLMILSKCFGLFTFEINKIEHRGRTTGHRLQRSVLACVWSVFLIGIIFYTNYLIPILDCWMYTREKWLMIDYSKSFQTILGSLIVVALWIYFLLNQNSLIKMANRFIQIDCSLRKYRHIFQLAGLRNFIIITAILVLMWITEVILENSVYARYDTYLWYVWWYKYLFPHSVFIIFIIQYATVVRCVKIRVQSLNRGFARMANSSEHFQRKFTVAGQMFAGQLTIESFEFIRNLYGEMFKLSVEISELYAFPILLVLAYVTFLMITLVYYLVTMLMNFDSRGVVEKILPGLSFSVLTSLSVRLIREIEGLVKEFKKITPTAFEILHNFPDNHGFTASVRCFTQELLHKELRFTAWGLFPLDSTLFQSIFSSALTYSIIILQTQTSGRAAVTPSANQTR